MNANRLWNIGAAIIIVALIAGTWFLGASPQLAAAGAASAERASVESQNQAHKATVIALKKQYESIDLLTSELEDAREGVPLGKAQKEFLIQISAAAAKAGVIVVTTSVADPILFAPVPSVEPEVNAAVASLSAGNFYVLPTDIKVLGAAEKILVFTDLLQKGTRLFLVHDLTMAEGSFRYGTEAEVVITGEAFVLLDAASTPAPPVVETPATTEGEGEETVDQ